MLRGVRLATIFATIGDGSSRRLGSCLLRPAVGCDGVHFDQTLLLKDIMQPVLSKNILKSNKKTYISPSLRQDYETPNLPSGLLFKFTFFENWCDGYYVGLDGLEMFDGEGRRLDLCALGARVTAVPHSLQDLDGELGRSFEPDPRTPEKLFFPLAPGVAPGQAQHTPWLAPLSRSMTSQERAVGPLRVLRQQRCKQEVEPDWTPELPLDNVLFVLFDHPQTISLIR